MPVPSYHPPLSERAAFWLMIVRGLVVLGFALYIGYVWLSPGIPPHG